MVKSRKFNKKKQSLKKNKLHNKLHIKHTIRKNKLKYNKIRKTIKGGNQFWKSNTIKLEGALSNIKIEPSFELAKNSIKNASKSGEDAVRHMSDSAMHLKNHISNSFNKYFNISYN